jgi:hypothetical protein
VNYRYIDNAGTAKTGVATIAYVAQPVHFYVASYAGITYCDFGGGGSLVNCATTGTGISDPIDLAFGGSFAFVSSTIYDTIVSCPVNSDGSFGSCATVATGVQQPQRVAVNGNWLYAADVGHFAGPLYCGIRTDGTLSSCVEASAESNNQMTSLGFVSGFAYIGTVGDSGNPGVITCTANSDGSLTSCGDSGTGLPYANLSVVGGYVYATAGNSQVHVCSVNVSNGALTCTIQTITVSGASSGGVSLLGPFAANGNHMYLSYATSDYGIAVCDLASDGTLSNCVDAGLNLGWAIGVEVH